MLARPPGTPNLNRRGTIKAREGHTKMILSDYAKTADKQRTRIWVLLRAGGRCECERACLHHLGGRCSTVLTESGWDMHRKVAGGEYSPENVVALCKECHYNTSSYGTGRNKTTGIIEKLLGYG